ncbi:MAG: recombination protein O N-terminal domain-containing protein [Candidatus Gracilibacteria bacterium]|nr:recombination protein O N-terminal domain-containing protein [Candidatus Gracilibacteria bacterium]
MFVVDGIILKKLHIKESKSIVYIYTRDFGKISAWIRESKLKYPIDIGNVINVSITTKGNVNQIDSYKIKKIINYSSLTFGSISNILELITYLYKIIPEGVPSENTFDEYLELIELMENNEMNKNSTEFFKLKLITKAGIGINSEKSMNFKKLFEFAKSNKVTKMIQIKGISESLMDEISEFNKESYNLYLK